MKRFSLLAFAFLFCFSSLVAQNTCLPGGITFTSQAQIDNFRVNYPDCTEILGDVDFLTVSNVDSLVDIENINGSVYFNTGCFPLDVSSFSNLYKIGGDVTFDNGRFINGFPVLDSIMGQLLWEGQPVYGECTDINGDFPALRYAGSIVVSPYARESFAPDDFPVLERVEGNLSLGSAYYDEINDFSYGIGFLNCASCCEFAALKYVGGSLSIKAPEAIEAFNMLDTIGGNLSVRTHSLIGISEDHDITGFERLKFIGGNLHFYESGEISWFSFASVNLSTGLDSLNTIQGDISARFMHIESFGLNQLEQLGGLYMYESSANTNDPLPAFSQLSTIGNVFILLDHSFSSDFNHFRLQNITAIENNLELLSVPSPNNFVGFDNLTSIGGSLIVDADYWSYPSNFQNFEGLNSLTSIGQDLQVTGAYSFQSLDGLENLNSIGGSLILYNNNALTDISALSNIDHTQLDSVSINSNSLLSWCSIESICNHLNDNGPASIAGNPSLCSSVPEVQNACIVPISTANQFYNLSIFPNPNTGLFTIKGTNQGTYKILNINGQIVQQGDLQENGDVDMSIAAQGIYFIHLSVNGDTVIRRIAKL